VTNKPQLDVFVNGRVCSLLMFAVLVLTPLAIGAANTVGALVALKSRNGAVGGERRMLRFGRTELRTTVQIDVPQLRARVDSLAAERRELDAALQRISWDVDLVD
jgi:hypothetical protein